MNLSYHWLSEYVHHGLSPQELGDTLTRAGLELESLEPLGRAFDGVVVGDVLDVQPHPNADRLRVCQVRLEPGAEPVPIVCGAPNVATGQRVPVATVGTVLELPARDGSGTEPVEIRKSKIRGEVSLGMICAEDELGIGDDHDGILVLDEGAEVGQPFTDYVAQRDPAASDTRLEIAITPNRPDATSHVGVARDVAALTGGAFSPPQVEVPEAGGEASEAVSVTIEDAAGCPRYTALVIRGVTVGPSPDWIKRRLEAIGVRSINNVVDVTNYVMMETGQPLHAFDLDQIAGGQITVRASQPGERFTTLDDVERELPEGTVLICDRERPVALGGLMGGANSEVSDATTDVLLESAYFDPVRIRRAAKALGLQTDASYRFERGIDPTAQLQAAARAAALLADVAGGAVASGAVDAHPRPHEPVVLDVRPARVRALLGADIPAIEMQALLRAIGFEVEASTSSTLEAFAEGVYASGDVTGAAQDASGTALKVTVPPFRPDVTREVDVVEEIARLWGYDRIPRPGTVCVPNRPVTAPRARTLADAARDRLAGLGFRETYTNSLLPRATAEAFAAEGPEAVVETLNPVSQEMAALRPSLLPGLLDVVAYNQNRGAGALRLMEWGTVFSRSERAEGPVPGYRERTVCGLVLAGPVRPGAWDGAASETDFYDLKGTAALLLDALGIDGLEEEAQPEGDALYAFSLLLNKDGREIGRIARVSEALETAHDLRTPVYFAALDWDALADLAPPKAAVAYAPISRFPTVERDLALVVDEAQPVGPLLQALKQAAGPLLRGVEVFDVYRGDGIPGGKKSVAFALRFGADQTLTDKQVDARVKAVTKRLGKAFGAEVRG